MNNNPAIARQGWCPVIGDAEDEVSLARARTLRHPKPGLTTGRLSCNLDQGAVLGT